MSFDTEENCWKNEGFLKAFNNPDYADVIIKAGSEGAKFYAHQAVIRMASDRLNHLCQTDAVEEDKKLIILRELEPQAVGIALRWMYGERHLDNLVGRELATNVAVVASSLGLDKLGVGAFSRLSYGLPELDSHKARFDQDPEYWRVIRGLSNWTQSFYFANVNQAVTKMAPSLPSTPAWVVEFAKECGTAFLAMLLLERQQRIFDFWLCRACQQLPPDTFPVPGNCDRYDTSCFQHRSVTLTTNEFVRKETIGEFAPKFDVNIGERQEQAIQEHIGRDSTSSNGRGNFNITEFFEPTFDVLDL
ncbi:hypothetical protein TWF730_003628 [Orbilia blumenaviensis]|uniref:BTB domain-containing protein n=1 Tax=Orbilia blumenaviensis TaxID=1796055 RepID=A0AAV9U2N1_9PEZI